MPNSFETFREHNRTIEAPSSLASEVWGADATVAEEIGTAIISLDTQELLTQKEGAKKALQYIQKYGEFTHPVNAEVALAKKMEMEDFQKGMMFKLREDLDVLAKHGFIERTFRGRDPRPKTISVTEMGLAYTLEPTAAIEVAENGKH